MSTNNDNQPGERVSPASALLEELERRTRPLTITQDMAATNHLIGSLACVLEDVPGGPEDFLRCVDKAVEFATRQRPASQPLTEALERAARERKVTGATGGRFEGRFTEPVDRGE